MRVILFILFPLTVFSQLGGKATYSFLDIPVSARSASLGGKNISTINGDINSIEDNPALLDSQYVNNLSLTYINYIADINTGYVGYANTVKNWGVFHVGLHYFNYGKFTRANYLGDILGEFSAADYSLNISYAKYFDSTFTVGATLKHIFSDYDSYESFGLAGDLGAYYRAKNGLTTAGLTLNNMGAQVVGYTKGTRERLPFRIDFAVSQKLGHAPIRFDILVQHLEKWDLAYNDPSVQSDVTIRSIADKAFRHFILGVEVLPSKNLFFNLAFDYQKRQELKLAARTGLVGFSFGAGLKLSKFSLSYARSSYHLGGASNHITLTTDLRSFKNKVQVNAKN